VPLAVARVLGATAATDAFFLAFALVSFVLTAIAGATQHAFVPVLIYLNRERARTLLALVQTVSLVVTATVVGALTVGSRFAGPNVGAFVTDLLPFGMLAVLASVWTGALYAERQYVIAAMSPAIRSVGVLFVLGWLGSTWGVWALVWGYTVAELVRLGILAVSLHPPMLSWRVDLNAKTDFMTFLRTGGAQAAGSALIALIPVIDRFAAAVLPRGSISLLDYAERVCQVPVGLLMSGFLVVSLAQWSHDIAQGDSVDRLRMKTRGSSIVICGVSLVPIAMLFLYRQSLTSLLFGRAHLDAGAIATLADTLGMYLLGVPLLLAGLIYARAFLVLRRTDWLLKVSVTQLAAKILFNAVLTPIMGLPGIALATAAVYGLGSIAHVWRLHSGTLAMDDR
jgi:putative peptidoglycan lipid II flippase